MSGTVKQRDIVRGILFNNLRMGDTFHSRSTDTKADIIVYSSAWGKGKVGRQQARAALKNPLYPNHSGSVLDTWGQKYPIEAGPLGYMRGDFDEYRTRQCRIVAVQRWSGFDNPETRAHAGRILEYWARKQIRYDWGGAPSSTGFGRYLLPWASNDPDDLYCSEGALGVHILCGVLDGKLLPFDMPIRRIAEIMNEAKAHLPPFPFPEALRKWMASRSDFSDVEYETR